jgi:hypothetical protein
MKGVTVTVTVTVFSYSNVLSCELSYLRTTKNLFNRRHSFEKKSTKYVSGKKTAESFIRKPSPG